MPNLIIALVILFGGWWLLRSLGNAKPAHVRLLMRKVAGGGLIAAAGFLALRGAIQIAAPLFLLGLSMFGQFSGFLNTGAFWKKPAGQKSRVVTSVLVMELDHDTGAMDGEVVSGRLKGRRLSSLADAELRDVAGLCRAAPDQSLALLQAWLDRAKPNWRSSSGEGNGQETGPRATVPGGAMAKAEAYEILGLKPGCSPDDVRAAHRQLMKQFHPDKGGTTYLATKINLAKDRLLQD